MALTEILKDLKENRYFLVELLSTQQLHEILELLIQEYFLFQFLRAQLQIKPEYLSWACWALEISFSWEELSWELLQRSWAELLNKVPHFSKIEMGSF